MKTTSTWRKTSTANILMPQNTPILRETGSQQSLSDPDRRERLPYDEQENRQSHLESAKLRGGTVTMSPQPHQFSLFSKPAKHQQHSDSKRTSIPMIYRRQFRSQ